ncbi:MAG TPA: dienelactone hydrolase family protein [Allosphingosinicella sp.]|jgi:carboxymethylenebutenolidase|nr:dienelactone hydrolase family protein [Allosphingosinicella sp.]
MDDLRAAAIALYDRYTHEGMDRRAFMAELTRVAGSAAAASALLAGIAADPAAATLVPEADKRIRTHRMNWPVSGGRTMKGYRSEPRSPAGELGSVLVIHENRGLNAHIEDVTRRFAVAGFRAVAADFLSPVGGTPTDQDAARDAIGKLDLWTAAADAVATLRVLKSLPASNGKVGAVGFCWGGGMVNRIALVAGAALDAGVSFYGPAPDPALAPQVRSALQLHFAELDERVNKTGFPWRDALAAAGGTVEAHVYPKVNHAFHNDTSAERYNAPAAQLAWTRTLDFLGRHLAYRVVASG